MSLFPRPVTGSGLSSVVWVGDAAATLGLKPRVKYGLCIPNSDNKGILQETNKTDFIRYCYVLPRILQSVREQKVL